LIAMISSFPLWFAAAIFLLTRLYHIKKVKSITKMTKIAMDNKFVLLNIYKTEKR
jgi:hypothetical protein